MKKLGRKRTKTCEKGKRGTTNDYIVLIIKQTNWVLKETQKFYLLYVALRSLSVVKKESNDFGNDVVRNSVFT